MPHGAPIRLGFIGCGDVATRYAERFADHPELELHGAVDRNPPRTERLVTRFGGHAYPSIDALLDDPEVDVVVNLTRQRQHSDITRSALLAGKHVYSEKPLALDYEVAKELADLADEHGLRLACAPSTFLGESQQKAAAIVTSPDFGTVRVVYAEANWGRIERWHPRPQDFYGVGPLFDVGVYPLTIVTSILGPASCVRAHASVLLPERTTIGGEPFSPEAPDFVVAVIELANHTLVRLTTTFFVEQSSRQRGIEFHGDLASLHLGSWHDFDATLELSHGGDPAVPVDYARPLRPGADYARGLAELAAAIQEGRPHRASGRQAAHVVEILEATIRSAEVGAPRIITSSFVPVAASPH
ncbi:MAG TPA: Gfo/Idh/MocA family oxidoreductase [Acidimicrobiales bacterium]|nr:Gfo/Idh/MocA family oxidoreductase [Acidimicrobiales bacterium]